MFLSSQAVAALSYARLNDAEEQAKAKALVDYYRICFAHPAVEGILIWSFWEGAN